MRDALADLWRFHRRTALTLAALLVLLLALAFLLGRGCAPEPVTPIESARSSTDATLDRGDSLTTDARGQAERIGDDIEAARDSARAPVTTTPTRTDRQALERIRNRQ